MTDAERYELTEDDMDLMVGDRSDDTVGRNTGPPPDEEDYLTGRMSRMEMDEEVISPDGDPVRTRRLVDDRAAEEDAFKKFAEVDDYRVDRAAEEGFESYELLTGRRPERQDETLLDEDDSIEEPQRKPATGKALQGDVDAAITLLRKHKAPSAILDKMSDADIVAWAEELKPVHAANQDAHRRLSELRKGKEEAPTASDEAASTGSPARINLDELTASLKDEIGEEAGGKLADAFRALADENAALRKQVSGIAKVSDSESLVNGIEALSKDAYPQLARGADGWRDSRQRVKARAEELKVSNKTTGRYRNYADLLRDAALLELGAPEREHGTGKDRRAIHRLRDQGQPREGRTRSASRFSNEDLTDLDDQAYNSFRRREADKAARHYHYR